MNRLFGLSVFTIVGWIVSISVALSALSTEVAVLLGRFAFAFAGAMPFTLLWMFHAFPVPQSFPRKTSIVVPGLFCLLFALLSFSPWIVVDAERTASRTNFIYGPLHPAFSVYVVSCFGLALVILGKKLHSATGLRKLQLRYLLLGILLGGMGVITTNLLIPLLWKTSRFSVLGPYFTLLMVSFSAHAIIRHRLMDIRLVVKRGIVYLIAAAIAGAIFVAIVAIAAKVTADRSDELHLVVQVVVALGIALAFQPLKQRIQTALDRYLYRESYDYRLIVREASRTIGSLIDLKSLVHYLTDVTRQTLHPDSVAIFTKDAGSDRLVLAERTSFSEVQLTPSALMATSPLLAFLTKVRRPLLRDELDQTVFGSEAQEAVEHLSGVGGELALPMLSDNQLVGIIIIGPKLSGDAYFAEDIELLSTLSNQAVVAIQNAQLYSQVLLANEYIGNILRTMDSGVITVDASSSVALCNATAEVLTGIPRPVLTTSRATDLPGPLASQLQATLTDGQPRLQIETALPAEGHRLIPIVCSTSALRDKHGTILGALAVFSDLSKIKALEGEKRRAERLASFGALASGIAHEIKNPLVAIKTFAELLPERFSDTDFREDFAKVVITEIDRIDGLVSRLRGIAAPSPQPVSAVDVREPIADTLSLLRAQLEQAGTAVTRRFEDSAPYVAIEQSQLKQLFLNIFMNAIEAMGTGGQLSIRVHRKEAQGSSWIVVAVTDTGPGISDSLLPHVFEPFFTTKARGSGLGLAICRGITDAGRGTIRAERNKDSLGTTIVIEFPATQQTYRLVEQSVLP